MAELEIFMGSPSDKPVVRDSGMEGILEEVLGRGAFRTHVCSAHRNARRLDRHVENACKEGTKVFIGIAGMTAALPGALAANSRMSRLVIGVPLDEHGIDACLYMPPGVPVALAGVGKTGLKQAALMACQVLAIDSEDRTIALARYLERTVKAPEFDIDLAEV